MSTVVAAYGTGYLRTTITREDDGSHRWTRRPGPDRDGEIRAPHPALRSAVASIPEGRVALTLPEPSGDGGVTYRTRRFRSVAFLFLAPPPDGTDPRPLIEDTLTEAARTLARLHAVPVPGVELPDVPTGVRRLLGWLRGGTGPRGAAELHRRAGRVLGRERLDLVESWCAESGDRRVLLHGAPGHGVLLPGGELLIGEDLAAGPPEFDLGWLVGELVEFGHAGPPDAPYGRADHDSFIETLLDAYPAPLDLAAVGRVALLRFLTHTRDYASFMGWHDMLDGYLTVLADVIDAAAEGRLLREASRR